MSQCVRWPDEIRTMHLSDSPKDGSHLHSPQRTGATDCRAGGTRQGVGRPGDARGRLGTACESGPCTLREAAVARAAPPRGFNSGARVSAWLKRPLNLRFCASPTSLKLATRVRQLRLASSVRTHGVQTWCPEERCRHPQDRHVLLGHYWVKCSHALAIMSPPARLRSSCRPSASTRCSSARVPTCPCPWSSAPN